MAQPGRVLSLDEDEDSQDTARMAVVESLMRSWEARYSDFSSLRLFAGTYNINGQAPKADLGPWLTDAAGKEPPDIYALGFQELDLSQAALFNGHSPREEEWAQLCWKGLHPGASYVEKARIRLVGMLLIVYVRRGLLEGPRRERFVADIHTASVATGFLNQFGNKGGVGVSLSIADTSVLFLCSHLAAGSDELERRNQDFRGISQLSFGPNRKGINDHDAVVWIGDLNYRFAELSPEAVKYACSREDWAGLLDKDQLRRAQAEKLAFAQFSEGPLLFQPTYKYDPGTDRWDSSEKGRAPAWCDRILFMEHGTKVELDEYSSVHSIRISDHKPVYAKFRLQVKEERKADRDRIYQEALKEGDRRANEALPQISLATPDCGAAQFSRSPVFEFGRVHFLHPTSAILLVRNTGKFPVKFRFREKPAEESPSPPWLSIFPQNQRILPDEEATVNLQVLIDKETVWRLNREGKRRLEDTLILHLRNGRDYFISVSADWVPSSFGLSLEAGVAANAASAEEAAKEELLVDLSESPHLSQAEAERAEQAAQARREGVPLALFRLVRHIRLHGPEASDLFSQAGSHKDFEAIRAVLDEEGEWTELPGRIHSVLEALLRYLDSLPEPLVPRAAVDLCLRATAPSAPPSQAWETLNKFPPAHAAAAAFLARFLRDVHAGQEADNIDFISTVFASVLFGLDRGGPSPTPASTAAASKFLAQLIRSQA